MSQWQLAAQAGRPRPLEPSTAAGTASGTEWSLVKFKFTGKFKFGSDESWPVLPDLPAGGCEPQAAIELSLGLSDS